MVLDQILADSLDDGPCSLLLVAIAIHTYKLSGLRLRWCQCLLN